MAVRLGSGPNDFARKLLTRGEKKSNASLSLPGDITRDEANDDAGRSSIYGVFGEEMA